MSYVTAITDRVLSDVTTPTSKGYMNVADWSRIYGNSRLAHDLAEINIALDPIAFTPLTTPTTATVPTITEFNAFLTNIETLRLATQNYVGATIYTAIKDDYVGGPGSKAPNYVDVNYWESVIDAIWTYFAGPSLEVCPTITTNITVADGVNKIYIDCVDITTGSFDIQGTSSNLVIL